MGTRILTAIATAVLTVTFASQAAAQTLTGGNVDNASRVFAQELFGPNSGGVKVSIRGHSNIQITYPSTANVSVDSGNYAIVTFRIQGARLAEPVRAGDFTFRLGTSPNTVASGFTFTAGENEGGGLKGDDFVSYRVTSSADSNAATVLSATTGSISNHFRFNIPDLDTISVANEEDADDRKVTIAITVTPPAGSRFGSAGNTFPKFPSGSTVNNEITAARIEPAYSVVVTPASTSIDAHLGNINLDDPTLLTATSSSPLIDVSGVGDTVRKGVKISTVTVMATSGNQSTAVGNDDFSLGTTDRFRAAVTGNFAASDTLFLSTMTSGAVTYDEDSNFTLAISSDGTSAEGSRPFGGTGAIVAGTPYALYFVPGGGQIRRGSIGSTYTIDVAAATGRDNSGSGKDLTLEYSGINFTNYAYAIPGPDAIDLANLRIRCEGASACVVFFRCTNEQGMPVGDFVRQNISAGALEYISARDLATLLDVDTWNGRLSCSLHSSSRVAVQLLVRSDGTLTNNTFIGGLDPGQ